LKKILLVLFLIYGTAEATTVTVQGGYGKGVTVITLNVGQGASLSGSNFLVQWYNSQTYSNPTDDPKMETAILSGVNGDVVTLLRNQTNYNHNTLDNQGQSSMFVYSTTFTPTPSATNLTANQGNAGGWPWAVFNVLSMNTFTPTNTPTRTPTGTLTPSLTYTNTFTPTPTYTNTPNWNLTNTPVMVMILASATATPNGTSIPLIIETRTIQLHGDLVNIDTDTLAQNTPVIQQATFMPTLVPGMNAAIARATQAYLDAHGTSTFTALPTATYTITPTIVVQVSNPATPDITKVAQASWQLTQVADQKAIATQEANPFTVSNPATPNATVQSGKDIQLTQVFWISQRMTVTQTPVPVAFQPDQIVSGTLTANGQAVTITPMNGIGGIALQVTGTWTGQINFEVTCDGTNWVARNANNGVQTVNAIAGTGNGVYLMGGDAVSMVRARSTAAMTGTATITFRSGIGAQVVSMNDPLPSGPNTIGSVTILGGGPITLGASSVTIGSVTIFGGGPITLGASGVSLLAGAANIGSMALQAGQTISIGTTGTVSLAAGTTILDNIEVALTSPTPSTYINQKSYSAGPITLGANTAVSLNAGQTISVGSPSNVGVTFMATPQISVFGGAITGVSAGISTAISGVTINTNGCFTLISAAVTNTGGSGAVDWTLWTNPSPTYGAWVSQAAVTASGASAVASMSVTVPLAQSAKISIFAITSAATTAVGWLGGCGGR
jgi:hypothetical protein